MKDIIISIILLLSCCFVSCSPLRLNFVCDEPTVDIYIDGEYFGNSMVTYVFPKGRNEIVVTCINDGQEVYHRTIRADGWTSGEVIDLQIQKDYQLTKGAGRARVK